MKLKSYILLLALALFACDSGDDDIQNEIISFEFGGFDREYLIQIPSNYSDGELMPLLIGFHGAGADLNQLGNIGFDIIGDTDRFISVFPQGINNRWVVDDGVVLIDDVAFTEQIIELTTQQFNIDPNRIFAFGFSNGGFMAQRLACKRPTTFRAIASVAGSISRVTLGDCEVGAGTSVLAINSVDDESVLYEGTQFGSPIEDMMDHWREVNQCSSSPTIETFTPITACANFVANSIHNESCAASSEVELIQIQDLAHAWPCWSAVEIWNFFDRQR